MPSDTDLSSALNDVETDIVNLARNDATFDSRFSLDNPTRIVQAINAQDMWIIGSLFEDGVIQSGDLVIFNDPDTNDILYFEGGAHNRLRWVGRGANRVSSGVRSLDNDRTISVNSKTGVVTVSVANGAVTTRHIVDNAVTGAKLPSNAVNSGILAIDSVTNSKIPDNAVTRSKIASGAINATKLDTDNVGNVRDALTRYDVSNQMEWIEVINAAEEVAFTPQNSVSGVGTQEYYDTKYLRLGRLIMVSGYLYVWTANRGRHNSNIESFTSYFDLPTLPKVLAEGGVIAPSVGVATGDYEVQTAPLDTGGSVENRTAPRGEHENASIYTGGNKIYISVKKPSPSTPGQIPRPELSEVFLNFAINYYEIPGADDDWGEFYWDGMTWPT